MSGAPPVHGLVDIGGMVEPLDDPRFIRRNLGEPLTLFLEDGRKLDISVIDTYASGQYIGYQQDLTRRRLALVVLGCNVRLACW